MLGLRYVWLVGHQPKFEWNVYNYNTDRSYTSNYFEVWDNNRLKTVIYRSKATQYAEGP